tara:strand:- start:456 stop:623 length:168 start_codon:yes stop_codon:yes gene_type:complete
MIIKHLSRLLAGRELIVTKKLSRYGVWIVNINGAPFAIDEKLGEEYVSKVKHKKV